MTVTVSNKLVVLCINLLLLRPLRAQQRMGGHGHGVVASHGAHGKAQATLVTHPLVGKT